MTDTRFTPGPLKPVKAYGHEVEPIYMEVRQVEGDFRGTIANCYHAEHIDGVTREEMFANAHLIAAAPELYEALEELQNIVSGLLSGEMGLKDIDSFTNQPARAALAKARGEQS